MTRAWAVIAVALLSGCGPSAPADPPYHPPPDPEMEAVPADEYYTGSDADTDYFVILHGSDGKPRYFGVDRDPKRWPNPIARTQDKSQWHLVPGSSASP